MNSGWSLCSIGAVRGELRVPVSVGAAAVFSGPARSTDHCQRETLPWAMQMKDPPTDHT